jgi:hypothetical protein
MERRRFLRGVGIAGGTLASATGLVGAAHSDTPSIVFPDGTALVLPEPTGPVEAAVRTREVYMPDGGWVVISQDRAVEQVIGHSINRLPAGHFERLLVAVQAQTPGCHTLYATLFRGARGDVFPEDAQPYRDAQDPAQIAFGKQFDCGSEP